ncbi:MAG TPA: GNAT family N-acetyltransferase [Anaerolineae bacterium]|nr:GNAT family N-acetyltransferase [Anaerolineae bacterium]
MSAQLAIDQRTSYRGLRPLDPHKDLNQVADLIEEAFTGELEPGGIAALRDLRMLSRMGPLVGLMARSDPYLEDVLGGFVWVEDDRVVGNVTIQRLDVYGTRWQIANVAVTKGYQGRGIGRALVMAALERIADRRGGWAVLQVRSDNPVAKGLYQRLGFEGLTEDVLMQLDQVPSQLAPVEPPAGLRPYSHDEWQARYTLESVCRSELAQWWRPVRSYDFMQLAESRMGEKIWELLGRNRVRRWVIQGEHGLAAWLSIDAHRWQGMHRLAFAVHPKSRGQLEQALAGFALSFLAEYPRWPVRVEHQGEHRELVQVLEAIGFRVLRNHLAMRYKITAS